MLLLRLSDALSNKIIKDKPPFETSASECFDLKKIHERATGKEYKEALFKFDAKCWTSFCVF